jgi:hypothetical protein
VAWLRWARSSKKLPLLRWEVEVEEMRTVLPRLWRQTEEEEMGTKWFLVLKKYLSLISPHD